MFFKRFVTLLFFFALTASYVHAGVQDGLIAHYVFSGNANDISDNHYHAIVNSGGVQLTSDRFGHTNSAYHFAGGVSDYIYASIGVLPQGTAPRSLCLWAKSDDAAKDDNADHTVNWGTYSDGMGFGVMIFDGNTWYAYGHGSANDLNSGVAVTTNWQFLVCTYDGSILKIYVDGVLRNSRVSSLNTQGTDLIIGENPPPIQSWNSFDGCLDDIRIYNRALISAEVLELYAETSLPVSICLFEAEREPGVVTLHWKTASEINHMGFIIQRQVLPDGDWITMADYQSHPQLQGAGNTSAEREYFWIDREVQDDVSYQYSLISVDKSGIFCESDHKITVGLASDLSQFELMPAFPNPMRTETTLSFSLHESSPITLSVLDLLGRPVKNLRSGIHSSGNHTFSWNGKDANDQVLPVGCYFVILKTDKQCCTQKLLLLH